MNLKKNTHGVCILFSKASAFEQNKYEELPYIRGVTIAKQRSSLSKIS